MLEPIAEMPTHACWMENAAFPSKAHLQDLILLLAKMMSSGVFRARSI